MRRQLPAYSPLSLTALLGAIPGIWSRGQSGQRRLAERLHGDRPGSVVLTDSGTSALRLALEAATATRPGAVALPAYGCYDLATAADGAGVAVELYDLDPRTLQPDIDSLLQAVRSGAEVVVVTHLYGVPVDVNAIRTALPAGAIVIEDAAQAAGATVEGIPAGTTGDFIIRSFGRGKGTTAGRGGALFLARGHAASGRVDAGPSFRLVEFATLSAQWLLGRPALYAIPSALPFLHLGETIYHPPHQPHGMSGVAARVLHRTLDYDAAELATRQRNAARLLAATGPRCSRIAIGEKTRPGWLRLPLRDRRPPDLPLGMGVMRGYPATLAKLPGFTRVRNAVSRFPGADELVETLITLPTHSLLSERDLRQLERWLQQG